jgi:hypothetical protein
MVRFYLFLAVYSMGVDVAGVVFYSELFPNHIRAKGVCLSMATVALTDLVYLQATTTAFANIGWRFYLVFIIICAVGTVFFYFVSSHVPVPAQSLEEIMADARTSFCPRPRVYRWKRWRVFLGMMSLLRLTMCISITTHTNLSTGRGMSRTGWNA